MSNILLLFAVAFMEGLNHAVLPLNVILDFLQIFWHLSEISLLLPVHRLLWTLSGRQDVLDGVSGDKVFIGFEALNWFFCNARHWSFLMAAIVGKVSN